MSNNFSQEIQYLERIATAAIGRKDTDFLKLILKGLKNLGEKSIEKNHNGQYEIFRILGVIGYELIKQKMMDSTTSTLRLIKFLYEKKIISDSAFDPENDFIKTLEHIYRIGISTNDRDISSLCHEIFNFMYIKFYQEGKYKVCILILNYYDEKGIKSVLNDNDDLMKNIISSISDYIIYDKDIEYINEDQSTIFNIYVERFKKYGVFFAMNQKDNLVVHIVQQYTNIIEEYIDDNIIGLLTLLNDIEDILYESIKRRKYNSVVNIINILNNIINKILTLWIIHDDYKTKTDSLLSLLFFLEIISYYLINRTIYDELKVNVIIKILSSINKLLETILFTFHENKIEDLYDLTNNIITNIIKKMENLNLKFNE